MRLLTKVKSGETLAEVMVSFSLISIILMGVVSVTSDVMALAVTSRNQTEAILLAQKNLVIAKNTLQASCAPTSTVVFKGKKLSTMIADTTKRTYGTTVLDFDGVIYARWFSEYSTFNAEDQANYLPAIKRSAVVTITDLIAYGTIIETSNIPEQKFNTTQGGFYKLTSKIIWEERGRRWDYNISEIIKR